MRYIHRQIESVIKPLLDSFSSLAITGPRQSGKSTLLTQTLKDYQYVTLDDPITRERAVDDPRLFFSSLKDKAIIDEIQNAPELLLYAKILSWSMLNLHTFFRKTPIMKLKLSIK